MLPFHVTTVPEKVSTIPALKRPTIGVSPLPRLANARFPRRLDQIGLYASYHAVRPEHLFFFSLCCEPAGWFGVRITSTER